MNVIQCKYPKATSARSRNSGSDFLAKTQLHHSLSPPCDMLWQSWDSDLMCSCSARITCGFVSQLHCSTARIIVTNHLHGHPGEVLKIHILFFPPRRSQPTYLVATKHYERWHDPRGLDEINPPGWSPRDVSRSWGVWQAAEAQWDLCSSSPYGVDGKSWQITNYWWLN